MKNIFVSSTFTDFQNERDVLRKNVLPRLNEVAVKYGENVSFSDLRWGIDTSEINEEEITPVIISSCLDEIDRDRPYMLVMLGERYGYIPNKEDIYNESVRRELLLNDLEISITQLEIEYGLFNNSENQHVFIYFRYSDNNEELGGNPLDEKLQKLKDRLLDNFGKYIHFYSEKDVDTGKFSEIVFQDIAQDLLGEWKKQVKISEFENEYAIECSAIAEKAHYFCAYNQFEYELINKIKDNSQITVIGETGSGKSTLFSHIMCAMKNSGWDIIPFLSGYTTISTEREQIARTIIWYLEKILNIEPLKDNKSAYIFNELKNRLTYLYSLYATTDRSLLIGIDAIEMLDGEELWFIPEDSIENIHIIKTTANLHISELEESEYCELPQLAYEDKKIVINRILSVNGKNLSKEVVEKILTIDASKNPWMLYLIVNRLCMMDKSDYETINKNGGGINQIINQQLMIISNLPETVEQLSIDILKFMSETLSLHSAMVMVKLLAVSRRGLRFEDIYELLNNLNERILPLFFKQYIYCIPDLFITKQDGRIDFAHQSMRQALLDSEKVNYDRMIAMHFLTLDRMDPVRIEEVAYHLIEAGMHDELIKEIASIPEIQRGTVVNDLYIKLQNTPQLIRTILENIDLQKEISKEVIEFVKFTSYYVIRKYGEKFDDIQNGLVVLLANIQWIEKVIAIDNQPELLIEDEKSAYIWGCIAAGQLYSKYHNEEKNNLAIKYFTKSLKVSYELCTYKISAGNLSECSSVLYESAVALENSNNADDRNKAAEFYKMALYLQQVSITANLGYVSETDLENIALNTFGICGIYIYDSSEKSIQTAIDYLKSAVDYFTSFNMEEDNVSINLRIEYSRLYYYLGNAYLEIPDNESITLSIEKYKIALDIIKDCYLKTNQDALLSDISDICKSIAKAFQKIGGQSAYLDASLYAKEAVKYAQRNYTKRKFFGSIQQYGYALSIYAEILSKMDNISQVREGEVLIFEAWDLISSDKNETLKKVFEREQIKFFEIIVRGLVCLVVREDASEKLLKILEKVDNFIGNHSSLTIVNEEKYDPVIAHSLSNIYNSAASVSELLGDAENLKRGGDYAKAALAIEEIVNHVESDTFKNKRNLEVCLLKVGILTNSLPHLEKGLSIAKNMASEYNTLEVEWDYSFALIKNAELLNRREDRESWLLAKKHGEAAIAIRSKLLKEQDTFDIKESFIKALNAYTESLLRLGEAGFAKNTAWYALSCANNLLLESTEPDTTFLVAEQQNQYAKCLNAIGDMVDAIKYYQLACESYDAAYQYIQTFNIAKRYISLLIHTANCHAYLNNVDAVIRYTQTAIDIIEKYSGKTDSITYQLMLVEIFMHSDTVFEKLSQHPSYKNSIAPLQINMYKESIKIYEKIRGKADNPRMITNLSALYIGLAEILKKLEKNKEACLYFDQCYDLCFTHIDEVQDNDDKFILVSNGYRSLSEKGIIYFELQKYNEALALLSKSIELQTQKMNSFCEITQRIEIAKDSLKNFIAAITSACECGELDKAELYLENAKSLILILKIAGVETDAMSTMIKVLEKRYLLLYSMFSSTKKNNKETEIQEIYDKAEACGKHEQKIALLQKFIDMESEIPDEQKSAKTLVYSYNAFQTIAVCILQQNQANALLEAKGYYLKTVKRELQVLQLPAAQKRKMEILNDMIEDSMKGYAICNSLGDKEGAEEFKQYYSMASIYRITS